MTSERARAGHTRTLIHLKHSLVADEEIRAVLPDTLEEFFDEAFARGELKKLAADQPWSAWSAATSASRSASSL